MKKKIFNFVTVATSVVMMLCVCTGANAQEKEVFIGDRVIAVVGDRMILQSDLQMAEAYLKEQNKIPFTEDFSDEEKAKVLDQMMTQKLLAAQAILDSLELPESRVFEMVEERIAAMIDQYGSIQKVEEARRKPIYMLRTELMDQMREQMLSQLMTQSIHDKITVTPDEVKRIIKTIRKDSLPFIPEQYEYSQIILKAPSNESTRSGVKEQLLAIRNRVMNGDNFAALATFYSDDTESAKRGGEMVVTPQMVVAPFADAMVSLTVGQVSNIVETEFGFHIIELVEKNDDKYTVRHILLRSKFSAEDIAVAIAKLDSVQTEIVGEKIKFEEAALKFSEDEDTKSNGGLAINSDMAVRSGNVKMKSNKFFINDLKGDYQYLADLKEGEVSKPFVTYDNSGNKICKVVKLNNRIPEHISNVKEDYILLVDFALNIKQTKHFEKWLKKQKERMYVRIEEPYVKYATIEKSWGK